VTTGGTIPSSLNIAVPPRHLSFTRGWGWSSSGNRLRTRKRIRANSWLLCAFAFSVQAAAQTLWTAALDADGAAVEARQRLRELEGRREVAHQQAELVVRGAGTSVDCVDAELHLLDAAPEPEEPDAEDHYLAAGRVGGQASHAAGLKS